LALRWLAFDCDKAEWAQTSHSAPWVLPVYSLIELKHVPNCAGRYNGT
jgi:hypothetical protein